MLGRDFSLKAFYGLMPIRGMYQTESEASIQDPWPKNASFSAILPVGAIGRLGVSVFRPGMLDILCMKLEFARKRAAATDPVGRQPCKTPVSDAMDLDLLSDFPSSFLRGQWQASRPACALQFHTWGFLIGKRLNQIYAENAAGPRMLSGSTLQGTKPAKVLGTEMSVMLGE